MRNYPEWVVSFFAPMSLGAVSVALNAWWSSDELEYGLTDCGAKVLIADEERLQRIEHRLPDLGIPAIVVRTPRQSTDNITVFSDVIEQTQETELPRVDADTDDDCMMLYTSGSTGHPKGAISTHRNVIHAPHVVGTRGPCGQQARERHSSCRAHRAPVPGARVDTVFPCHRQPVCLLAGLRAGRRLTLMHKWDVDEALDTIEREEITHFITVPTISGDLTRAAREQSRPLPSLLAIRWWRLPPPGAAGARYFRCLRERDARHWLGYDGDQRDRHDDSREKLPRSSQFQWALLSRARYAVRRTPTATMSQRRARRSLDPWHLGHPRLLE